MIEKRLRRLQLPGAFKSWQVAALLLGLGTAALAAELVGDGFRQKAHVFNAGGGILSGEDVKNSVNFGEGFSHPRKMTGGDYVMRPGFLPKKKHTQQTPIAVGPAEPAPLLASRLLGNYPNPFNPMTTIRYALARDGAVSLKIYDVKGRLVRTLLDGPGVRGTHAARWDGRSDTGLTMGGGVYFARLLADGAVDEHKLIMIK